MQDENVRLVGRVPVVPRSDPGGVFCSCEGSPFVDKEADERANSYVGGVSLDFLITIVVRPRGSL